MWTSHLCWSHGLCHWSVCTLVYIYIVLSEKLKINGGLINSGTHSMYNAVCDSAFTGNCLSFRNNLTSSVGTLTSGNYPNWLTIVFKVKMRWRFFTFPRDYLDSLFKWRKENRCISLPFNDFPLSNVKWQFECDFLKNKQRFNQKILYLCWKKCW